MAGPFGGTGGVEFTAEILMAEFGNIFASHEASLADNLALERKCSRNAWRARLRRDITVPMGSERMPAISRQVKPSTTASKRTVRWSTGKVLRMRATSRFSITLLAETAESGSANSIEIMEGPACWRRLPP